MLVFESQVDQLDHQQTWTTWYICMYLQPKKLKFCFVENETENETMDRGKLTFCHPYIWLWGGEC